MPLLHQYNTIAIVLMVVFWSVQYAGVLCVVQCPCVLFVTVRHHYCTAAATLAPHSQVINRWEIYFNGECEIGIADWSMRNTMRFGITCQRRIWSCYWWRRDSVASASWYGGYNYRLLLVLASTAVFFLLLLFTNELHSPRPLPFISSIHPFCVCNSRFELSSSMSIGNIVMARRCLVVCCEARMRKPSRSSLAVACWLYCTQKSVRVWCNTNSWQIHDIFMPNPRWVDIFEV